MIEVPAAFAARIERVEGAAGSDWLAELPGRFARLFEQWELVADGAIHHGAMSLVLPVRRRGEPLVLKVTWPSEATAHEAAGLRWWDGRGTVRLLDALSSEDALLLERLDPGRTLAAVGLDEAATVTGELIRLLAIPAAPTMPTFTDEIAGVIASIETRWRAQGHPFDHETLGQVMAIARSLPVGADHLMLARDLWDDNVLAAGRRPWLVIDPQPMAGPPEYALAPSLLRRLDQMAAPGHPDRFINRACDAGVLNRELAIAGAVVRIADYWLWALETGLTEDPVRCRRLLGWMARVEGERLPNQGVSGRL